MVMLYVWSAAIFISQRNYCRSELTSPLSVDVDFDVGLLERSPFEVFPVAAALDLALRTLLTSGLFFATLESFGFTRHAACKISQSVHVRLGSLYTYLFDQICPRGPKFRLKDIPLRLLDCFGLGGPSLGAAVDCFRTGAFLVVDEACLRAPLATGG